MFDAEEGELMRGVLEEDALIFYDDNGEKRGEFRQEGDRIVAKDVEGARIGYIVVENARVVYHDEESVAASSWVRLPASE